MDDKPFAPSAERNRDAILATLGNELVDTDHVFEFGSGTGQHVCHFAAHHPSITWQPSDLAVRLPGMKQWIAESGCKNILPPVTLDLQSEPLASTGATVCYSANTLHIVSWPLVQRLFLHAATLLADGGKLCIYGPFLFNGQYTSEGNHLFDQQLRSQDSASGLREFNDLNVLAERYLFSHRRTIDLPANNQLLFWERVVTNAPG